MTVLFNVVAQGTAPLGYQWLFNATNQLSGATNSSLTLTSVTIADAGNYSVLVTNGFGSALSSPASLRVLVPSQILSLTRNQNVVAVTFSTVTNLLYSVYYNDLVESTNWVLLPKESLLPGTGQPIVVQDPRATGPQRFYRVLTQ